MTKNRLDLALWWHRIKGSSYNPIDVSRNKGGYLQMKKTNRRISIILALITAFSCVTMGVSAANVDESGNFILKPAPIKAEATKFALCETVHGNVSKGEQWYYCFNIPTEQDVTLHYTATSQINFQVESDAGVSVYSNAAIAGYGSVLAHEYAVEIALALIAVGIFGDGVFGAVIKSRKDYRVTMCKA